MNDRTVRIPSLAVFLALALMAGTARLAHAALLTDPNDPRTWQGASVGTFAQLVYGADTAENRQKVIDNQLLDDGVFDPTGYVTATLYSNAWSEGLGGGCLGTSSDLTGTGSYDFSCHLASVNGEVKEYANAIDNKWFQSSETVGQTVFDLGFGAAKAVVFPVIDHDPLPNEAIESTVYLSNDLTNWTQAVLERVWLEGYMANTGILWDGFAYAVGTGTGQTFRYASITAVGPGALQPAYGSEDEINGLMGLRLDFSAKSQVPEPRTTKLLALALAALLAGTCVRTTATGS